MTRRVQLPLAPADGAGAISAEHGETAALPPRDTLGRALTDLRISVTDRCNFRCGYCMPKEVFGPGFRFLPKPEILSFEEIARTARAFVKLGVHKLRLTGGEPLLRAKLERLVAMLAPLGAELALTTNGSLLEQQAERLANAGLSRVTVSLDALDAESFRRASDVDFDVAKVLSGIDAARQAGLAVKVNCVVRKGHNDDQILPLAQYFKPRGVELRFIEFMDVGTTNGWDLSQVVSGAEIVARISAWSPLEGIGRAAPHDVATRLRYADGRGAIGVISSVTAPFCGECSRARLSAEGKLYTCLFAAQGVDLRPLLRGGAEDARLEGQLALVWAKRRDRYSELRGEAQGGARPKIEMSYIGG